MKVLKIGRKESNLKISNYKEVCLKFDFPEISDLAFDIDYIYSFDGYLPSFLFNLMYKVPKYSKVKNFEKKEDGIIRLQTCIEMKDFKLVRYTEFEEHAA